MNGVDDFVWDGASEKYALDDAVSEQLRRSNPEAYRNVLARLLEAAGRGMWNADEDVLRRGDARPSDCRARAYFWL